MASSSFEKSLVGFFVEILLAVKPLVHEIFCAQVIFVAGFLPAFGFCVLLVVLGASVELLFWPALVVGILSMLVWLGSSSWRI